MAAPAARPASRCEEPGLRHADHGMVRALVPPILGAGWRGHVAGDAKYWYWLALRGTPREKATGVCTIPTPAEPAAAARRGAARDGTPGPHEDAPSGRSNRKRAKHLGAAATLLVAAIAERSWEAVAG
jgi:hypothetical protein